MKKFLRYVSVVLVLVFAICFAACSSGTKDPEDVGNGTEQGGNDTEQGGNLPEQGENPPEQGDPVDEGTFQISLDKPSYSMAVGLSGYTKTQITATVTKDGKVVEETPSYTVADEKVAMVTETGLVTAKEAGATTVTVKYKNAEATASITVHGKTTAQKVNSFAETDINLYGRVYTADGKLNIDHAAAGIEVTFYGEELTANIAFVNNLRSYARVFVDGDTAGTFVEVKENAAFPIVTGLKKGLHTVKFLKSSELDDGRYTISDLAAEQFMTPVQKPALKIEFIGDSITSGYGVFGGDTRSVENSDACSSYAFLAAQRLNAESSTVAVQGTAVNVVMWNSLIMSQMYPKVSPYSDADYDFNDGVDLVVLNLGTNDASYLSYHPAYSSEFANDYFNFLTFIRTKRPEARIICAYGNMGINKKIKDGITEAIERMNDDKITFFSPTAQTGGAVGHPGLNANKKNADKLADYIRALIAE